MSRHGRHLRAFGHDYLVGTYRFCLDLLLPEIHELEWQLAHHLIVNVSGDADAAGFCQSLESSRSGYAVNKVDFLSLVDSQMRVFDSELRLVRAVADRRAAFAAIEAAVGEKLR